MMFSTLALQSLLIENAMTQPFGFTPFRLEAG